MNAGVRERIWRVMEDWFDDTEDGSILMTWPDSRSVAGQDFLVLGLPRVELVESYGIFLSRREFEEPPK